MQVNKVCLIGAGQLGSRHLQGLSIARQPLDIMVVDPWSENLVRAKTRWIEVQTDGCKHAIQFRSKLPLTVESFDVTIIATTARNRCKIVEDFLRSHVTRHLVLEKIVEQSPTLVDRILEISEGMAITWVNFPRRLMEPHKKIAKQIDCMKLVVSLRGADWGLACNGLHFIDLVGWWAGCEVKNIDTTQLQNEWNPAKREDFFEVFGGIDVEYENGTTLKLFCDQEHSTEEFTVCCSDGNAWTIDENKGLVRWPCGLESLEHFPLQSEITGNLVDDLLLTGRCALPSLSESNRHHGIFLSSMIEHWNQNHEQQISLLPAT